MKEFYTRQPDEIELFTHNGQTDVIIRRGIQATQQEIEGGGTQDIWECDETQFRYPGILSYEEVAAQVESWLVYAGAESLSALDQAKQTALRSMSDACNSAIRAGFNIELSDGKLHHFSLEITDQITISILAGKAAAGQPTVPWHADDEACKFFSAADIAAINAQMEALTTYHQTYFNSLKQWILAVDSVEAVNAIQYGAPIPEEYQSEVMKAILRAGE